MPWILSRVSQLGHARMTGSTSGRIGSDRLPITLRRYDLCSD